MGSRNRGGLYCALLLAAVAAMLVAGCGGSSSTDSSGTGGSTGASTTGGSTEASKGTEGADVAAAEKILAPYIGKFDPPLMVEEALKEKPSPDVTVSMLQLADPIGGLVTEFAAGAAKTAGVQFDAVKAGASASTAQAAAETVVTQSPDGMLLPPFEPSVIANQLAELNENGTFIVGNGALEGEKYGIQGNLFPKEGYEKVGEVWAAWAVTKHGAETKALIVEHPELAFQVPLTEAFEGTLKELCPECTVDNLPIPAEDETKASTAIVSELQAKPDINQIVGISDFTTGLPAAEKAAGLDVGMFVYPGEPQTLEYIKNGELIEGTFASGLQYEFYVAMDMVLRSAQGMKLTKGEESGLLPQQILTQKDITFDPKFGWEPDPNLVESFEKFWHVK